MKTTTSTLFVFLVSAFSFAQDVIYEKNNIKIEGKILEVGISEIKYKLASNPDGPTYTISKSNVMLITYANGSHETFSSENSLSKFDSISVNYCKNLIGSDIAEFATISIGMTYERVFGKRGVFALRIPFSVGLGNNGARYDYDSKKIFNTGVDFLYFPTGQGTARYYVAPYFEWGMFRYREYQYWNYSFLPASSVVYSNGQHLAGGIKNGLLFQPTRHFSISVDVGFGIKKDETNRSEESIKSHLKVNFIIGYRF